jgi:5-methylcytosine-specific restriction endonuclease McrA
MENHEQFIENTRRWRRENLERSRSGSRDWQRRNPDKVKARNVNAKALRRTSNGSPIKAKDLADIYLAYGGLCDVCGDLVNEGRVTWDHIRPVSNGGEHSIGNLAPAHRYCNSMKSAGTLEAAQERVAAMRELGQWAIPE